MLPHCGGQQVPIPLSQYTLVRTGSPEKLFQETPDPEVKVPCLTGTQIYRTLRVSPELKQRGSTKLY